MSEPGQEITMENKEITILVVDDEEAVRHVLSVFLGKNGYQCATATSAEEAMEMLRQKQFNLVITDIMMPGASGFDLCRFINRTCPRTAVVTITGLSDTKYVSEAVRLGVIACLLKPFNLSQVSKSIERAVKYHSSSDSSPSYGVVRYDSTIN